MLRKWQCPIPIGFSAPEMARTSCPKHSSITILLVPMRFCGRATGIDQASSQPASAEILPPRGACESTMKPRFPRISNFLCRHLFKIWKAMAIVSIERVSTRPSPYSALQWRTISGAHAPGATGDTGRAGKNCIRQPYADAVLPQGGGYRTPPPAAAVKMLKGSRALTV